MRKFIVIIGVIISLGIISCQKENIGYLITEYANYEVDSLIIRQELDTSKTVNPEFIYYMEELQPYIDMGIFTEAEIIDMLNSEGIFEYIYGIDYYRKLKNQPWTSTAIEGIEGTNPILLSFSEVKTIEGDIDEFFEYAKVYGDGTIELPFIHEVPSGRYLISLKVKNEGCEKIITDIFTVIVE